MALTSSERKKAERDRRKTSGQKQIWLTVYEQKIIDLIRNGEITVKDKYINIYTE